MRALLSYDTFEISTLKVIGLLTTKYLKTRYLIEISFDQRKAFFRYLIGSFGCIAYFNATYLSAELFFCLGLPFGPLK